MCCVNEFADLIHRWYTLKCANCVAHCSRSSGMVKGLFAPFSAPKNLAPFSSRRAITCLSSQIRCGVNVLARVKAGLICLGLWEAEQCDSIVLGVSSLLQWVSVREGRKGLNRNWAGMLGAAVLQNIAVFVRRQVISRNTADTWPAAL